MNEMTQRELMLLKELNKELLNLNNSMNTLLDQVINHRILTQHAAALKAQALSSEVIAKARQTSDAA